MASVPTRREIGPRVFVPVRTSLSENSLAPQRLAAGWRIRPDRAVFSCVRQT